MGADLTSNKAAWLIAGFVGRKVMKVCHVLGDGVPTVQNWSRMSAVFYRFCSGAPMHAKMVRLPCIREQTSFFLPYLAVLSS